LPSGARTQESVLALVGIRRPVRGTCFFVDFQTFCIDCGEAFGFEARFCASFYPLS
jgi:hypothetical protein